MQTFGLKKIDELIGKLIEYSQGLGLDVEFVICLLIH